MCGGQSCKRTGWLREGRPNPWLQHPPPPPPGFQGWGPSAFSKALGGVAAQERRVGEVLVDLPRLCKAAQKKGGNVRSAVGSHRKWGANTSMERPPPSHSEPPPSPRATYKAPFPPWPKHRTGTYTAPGSLSCKRSMTFNPPNYNAPIPRHHTESQNHCGI